MCGIAGIVGLRGRPVADAGPRLARMGELLRHRGPDQFGTYLSDDGLVALFNNRLAIVGVDDRLQLPLRSTDGTRLLAFNGEIYNYRELRQRQRAAGTVFRTHTDTEVLLNGLIDEGPSFLRRAEGMWGFAYVDRNQGTIRLCRDVMGEKPLYYHLGRDELIFCSEVAPIVAVMAEEPEWNDDAIVCSFQYRAAPPGETLIRQIKRLRGGEAMSVDYRDGRVERSYPKRLDLTRWEWFFRRHPSLGEVCDLYEQEIRRACGNRFPDEVGFTATLSGGIDSTLINVMLTDYGSKGLRAIHGLSSHASPQRGADSSELETARYTARQLGIELEEFFLYDDESLEIHRQVAADSFDGVFCEGVASFRLLAKRARLLGNKVLMLSDGPDELLSGYDVDRRTFQLAQRLRRSSPERRAQIAAAAFARKSWKGRTQGLLNWAYLETEPPATRPNHAGSAPDRMAEMIAGPFRERAFKKYGLLPGEAFALHGEMDDAQRIGAGYLQGSLPDYVNTRSDRGTMGESIEVRLPFLATPLVELFGATPAQWRMDDGANGKRVLRELVERYLGPVVSRRGKYGFSLPIWGIPGNSERLAVVDTVRSAPVFEREVFSRQVKDVVLASGNGRFAWMAYTLAMTERRLSQLRATASGE